MYMNMNMNMQYLKDSYLNKKFLTIYFIIFIILYLLFSVLKFLGQLPILLIITFFIAYYFTSSKTKIDDINSDIKNNILKYNDKY